MPNLRSTWYHLPTDGTPDVWPHVLPHAQLEQVGALLQVLVLDGLQHPGADGGAGGLRALLALPVPVDACGGRGGVVYAEGLQPCEDREKSQLTTLLISFTKRVTMLRTTRWRNMSALKN